MPKIRIVKRAPEEEILQVFVDGDLITDDEFECDETFALAVNQYIEPRDPKSVKKNIIEMLQTFILGGRKTAGKEVESPWQAVWEGDCRAGKDGTLLLILERDNGHPSIGVVSDEIEIMETRSEDVIREVDKQVWIGNLLVFVVPFALIILIGSFFVIWTLDSESWYFSIPFMLFMWFMGGSAIYGIVKQARAANSREDRETRVRKTNKRIHRAINFLKFTVGVSIIGAAIQIIFGLTGLIDRFPWVGITAMPVGLTFIICMTISNNIFSKEDAKYFAETSEYPEIKKVEMWNRNAWIFGVVGILSAAFIAQG
jgi:hypothetical protein